jgi:hypothetical protein
MWAIGCLNLSLLVQWSAPSAFDRRSLRREEAMQKLLALAASATILMLIVAASAVAQQGAPASNNAADAAPVPYTMSMGDLMNTFVQPRHAKLGLAARAGNWPLATYALAELREVFAGITKAKPRFRGLPVGELADVALSQQMNAAETAIRQKDPAKFAAAYDQLTQGCNACHTTLNHPFLVIKAPDASAFANQDFGAGR